MFIAWIEENISPRPEQRYSGGCLGYTIDWVNNDQINNFRVAFLQVRDLDLSGVRDPGNLGLVFGRPEYKIRDLLAQRDWAGLGEIEIAPAGNISWHSQAAAFT